VVLSGCSTEIRWKPVDAYRRLSVQVDRAFGPADGDWHIVADMLAAMKGHSSLADLRRLEIPVWLVNGQRDILRLDERRYVAALPGARLTVVPGAGHDVNTHAPAAYNRILLGALHELRIAAAALAALAVPAARALPTVVGA
jgi:pimeloyl-ACP methyl ester carboxylesterase